MDRLTVASNILEKMLTVSDRRIRQLVSEGILVRVSKGKYDLVKSIANYIQYLKLTNELEQKEEGEKLDYDIEHAKNERVKRQQNEIKLQLMRGQVHKADQIEAVVTDMLVHFRTKILTIPEKLTPMVVGCDDPAYIKKLLATEIGEALLELKDYQLDTYTDKSFISLVEDDDFGDEDAETIDDDDG